MKGAKVATLGGTDIKLPGLNAPDAVGAAQSFWVRFIGDPKEWPGEGSTHYKLPPESLPCKCALQSRAGTVLPQVTSKACTQPIAHVLCCPRSEGYRNNVVLCLQASPWTFSLRCQW